MSFHEQLAGFAAETKLDHIGRETLFALKRTIIDTVGVAVAAAREDFSEQALRVCDGTSGVGRCSVFGRDDKLSLVGAAMLNGTLGHGFDFDDVHLPSVAHFSTIVIPAALAVSEMFEADGRRFLEGVLVGDEVAGRIGWAVCSEEWGGTSIRKHGFFPTAILGTIGAAAASAKIAGLSATKIAQAIAIAASYAGGLAAISRGDNSTKRTQAGWAAQAGVCAAMLAREGYTGPKSVLETNQGFFEAFTGGKYRPTALMRSSDDLWVCEEMSFKYYPIEYIIHPLVELANRARSMSVDLDRISVIEASVTSSFVTLFEPADPKVSPSNAYEASISAPYCIGRAFTKPGTGHLRLSDFQADYSLDESVRRIAGKVRFVPEPAFDRAFPKHVCGRLRLKQEQTIVWEDSVDDVYGSVNRPMTEEHLLEKFRFNCANLGASRTAAILETIDRLPTVPDAAWTGRLCGDV